MQIEKQKQKLAHICLATLCIIGYFTRPSVGASSHMHVHALACMRVRVRVLVFTWLFTRVFALYICAGPLFFQLRRKQLQSLTDLDLLSSSSLRATWGYPMPRSMLGCLHFPEGLVTEWREAKRERERRRVSRKLRRNINGQIRNEIYLWAKWMKGNERGKRERGTGMSTYKKTEREIDEWGRYWKVVQER